MQRLSLQTTLKNIWQTPLRWAKQLYTWTEKQASKKAAVYWLLFIAFIESIFFPIPPDVLLIPMSIANYHRSLFYAGVCLIGSVAGALLGYLLGAAAWQSIGVPVIEFYGLSAKVEQIMHWYQDYDAWIVAIAGFTPIPYKLFTLTSGAADVNLVVFIVASVLSRGARFFLIAGLIRIYGDRAAAWIDRHFNALTVLLVLIIILIVLLGIL